MNKKMQDNFQLVGDKYEQLEKTVATKDEKIAELEETIRNMQTNSTLVNMKFDEQEVNFHLVDMKQEELEQSLSQKDNMIIQFESQLAEMRQKVNFF